MRILPFPKQSPQDSRNPYASQTQNGFYNLQKDGAARKGREQNRGGYEARFASENLEMSGVLLFAHSGQNGNRADYCRKNRLDLECRTGVPPAPR